MGKVRFFQRDSGVGGGEGLKRLLKNPFPEFAMWEE